MASITVPTYTDPATGASFANAVVVAESVLGLATGDVRASLQIWANAAARAAGMQAIGATDRSYPYAALPVPASPPAGSTAPDLVALAVYTALLTDPAFPGATLTA